MRKPPRPIVIDEESFRRVRERPEAKEALDRLGQLIVESFVNALPAEKAAALIPWLDTPGGTEAFRESWPKIVDAYFQALCHPNPRSAVKKRPARPAPRNVAPHQDPPALDGERSG